MQRIHELSASARLSPMWHTQPTRVLWQKLAARLAHLHRLRSTPSYGYAAPIYLHTVECSIMDIKVELTHRSEI